MYRCEHLPGHWARGAFACFVKNLRGSSMSSVRLFSLPPWHEREPSRSLGNGIDKHNNRTKNARHSHHGANTGHPSHLMTGQKFKHARGVVSEACPRFSIVSAAGSANLLHFFTGGGGEDHARSCASLRFNKRHDRNAIKPKNETNRVGRCRPFLCTGSAEIKDNHHHHCPARWLCPPSNRQPFHGRSPLM